jgi:cobalamin biosynthesis protein CbiG
MHFSADAILRAEVELQGSEVVIRAPKLMVLSLRDQSVQKTAAQVVGKPVKVRVEAADNLVSSKPETAETAPAASEADELRQRALSDPAVKRFQELFPGAHIRAVRNLSE